MIFHNVNLLVQYPRILLILEKQPFFGGYIFKPRRGEMFVEKVS